jgi:hypothetical protein
MDPSFVAATASGRMGIRLSARIFRPSFRREQAMTAPEGVAQEECERPTLIHPRPTGVSNLHIFGRCRPRPASFLLACWRFSTGARFCPGLIIARQPCAESRIDGISVDEISRNRAGVVDAGAERVGIGGYG